MRSVLLRKSLLCTGGAMALCLAGAAHAGDGGGDGGGGNDRFKESEERQERRVEHAVLVVAALDGLAGGENGDSVTTP